MRDHREVMVAGRGLRLADGLREVEPATVALDLAFALGALATLGCAHGASPNLARSRSTHGRGGRAQKAAGLRPLRFHDLRHSFGSLVRLNVDPDQLRVIAASASLGADEQRIDDYLEQFFARPGTEQVQLRARARGAKAPVGRGVRTTRPARQSRSRCRTALPTSAGPRRAGAP